MHLDCGMSRARFLERASAMFAEQGYQIKMISPEVGILQVEKEDFNAWDGLKTYSWSLQYTGDSLLIVNAKRTRGQDERTYDTRNYEASPATEKWFVPVMIELQTMCGRDGRPSEPRSVSQQGG